MRATLQKKKKNAKEEYKCLKSLKKKEMQENFVQTMGGDIF